jgi:hypothetical protein
VSTVLPSLGKANLKILFTLVNLNSLILKRKKKYFNTDIDQEAKKFISL